MKKMTPSKKRFARGNETSSVTLGARLPTNSLSIFDYFFIHGTLLQGISSLRSSYFHLQATRVTERAILETPAFLQQGGR